MSVDNEPDNGALRAALAEAINQAKGERVRPLRLEQYRVELLRLCKLFGCLYALEYMQTPNIEIRREIEKLESTVFLRRGSVDVEMSRERVQQVRAEVWAQMQAVIDLICRERAPGGAGAVGAPGVSA
ncbi:MAG: hypothetical protein HC804_06880 [Anaerolineae bacterium]|nr:hypothetical protein [Anaerolineae bacterium]